jgi:RND family efflux transporter MFP subunit
MSKSKFLKTATLAVALACFGQRCVIAGRPMGREVDVVHARKGAIERTTTVPGSLIADQSARLFAKVSGYLKQLNVDIGDEVKAGDVLAVLDVPELAKEVEHNAAAFEQAESKVLQAKARLASAEADRLAADARLSKDRASLEDAQAILVFRKQIYERLKKLAGERAIEQQVVDEKQEEYQASIAAVDAAKAAIRSAEADLAATEAKIQVAAADVKDAEANVKVCRATWERSEVMLDYATIRAPFSGAITERNFFAGDFIRAAENQALLPLLSLHATDRLRAVVQVPDRDVPYANPGDPAVVQIDALPGRRFKAKISRIAKFESAESRTMRAEIDLDNKDDELRVGMYGRATLHLQDIPDTLLLSSQCLIERTQKGKAAVFVVHDGRLCKVDVHVGADNGIDTEILGGLTTADEVVFRPSSELREGDRVIVRK